MEVECSGGGGVLRWRWSALVEVECSDERDSPYWSVHWEQGASANPSPLIQFKVNFN